MLQLARSAQKTLHTLTLWGLIALTAGCSPGQTSSLLARGAAYHCDCSPEDLKARKEAALARGDKPKYDGRCRSRVTSGPLDVVVLHVPAEFGAFAIAQHRVMSGALLRRGGKVLRFGHVHATGRKRQHH